MTQRSGFNRHEQNVYFLPILVEDSGPPSLSSTNTLTIHICGCDPGECYTVTLRGFERLTTSNMFPILCPSNQAPSYLPIHLSIYRSTQQHKTHPSMHPTIKLPQNPPSHPFTHLSNVHWLILPLTHNLSFIQPSSHPSINPLKIQPLSLYQSIHPSINPTSTHSPNHPFNLCIFFICLFQMEQSSPATPQHMSWVLLSALGHL